MSVEQDGESESRSRGKRVLAFYGKTPTTNDMELPRIGDGTVQLRPFSREDQDLAIDWLSGPSAPDRSATDGGPVTDADDARDIASDLLDATTMTLTLEDEPVGWVVIRVDKHNTGHLQLLLSDSRLWVQGVGSRGVRLVLDLAFGHMGLDRLRVDGVPETAEAARVAW